MDLLRSLVDVADPIVVLHLSGAVIGLRQISTPLNLFLLFLPLEFGLLLLFRQAQVFGLCDFLFQLVLLLSDLQLRPFVGV